MTSFVADVVNTFLMQGGGGMKEKMRHSVKWRVTGSATAGVLCELNLERRVDVCWVSQGEGQSRLQEHHRQREGSGITQHI